MIEGPNVGGGKLRERALDKEGYGQGEEVIEDGKGIRAESASKGRNGWKSDDFC